MKSRTNAMPIIISETIIHYKKYRKCFPYIYCIHDRAVLKCFMCLFCSTLWSHVSICHPVNTGFHTCSTPNKITPDWIIGLIVLYIQSGQYLQYYLHEPSNVCVTVTHLISPSAVFVSSEDSLLKHTPAYI